VSSDGVFLLNFCLVFIWVDNSFVLSATEAMMVTNFCLADFLFLVAMGDLHFFVWKLEVRDCCTMSRAMGGDVLVHPFM
jgi:hypothetical protein